jgi:hypothetical protein
MIKPFTRTTTYRCHVPNCGRIETHAQDLFKGEQYFDDESLVTGWLMVGGLLICDRHNVKVIVDGKPTAEWPS